MGGSIIKIAILIFAITVGIYIVKNNVMIKEFFKKYKDKKIVKIIMIILLTLFTIYFVAYLCNKGVEIKNNYEWSLSAKENDEIFAKYDSFIIKENKYYTEYINKNYENQKYNEPYIPDGFSYVEGEWNSGFVIQDENQNQYVWIPCTNREDLDIEKLQRSNFSEYAFISKDLCNNNSYEAFIKSALENGGFYISRFEIGNENNKPVSKSGIEIYNNITRDDANNIIKDMYNNINCELINGYAYDTALSWIMNTNDIKENIIKIDENSKVMSGRTSYNNIYDFIDNVMELTSEETYSNIIIRGFPYEISEDMTDLMKVNFDYNIENFDRFSIRPEDDYFTLTTLLGIRTVLYK